MEHLSWGNGHPATLGDHNKGELLRIQYEKVRGNSRGVAASTLDCKPCRLWLYPICISADGKAPNDCPGYETKQSDDEALVMPEVWGMWSTLSLSLLPELVAPDRVLSVGEIELFDIYTDSKKQLMLNWIVRNRTVWYFSCV